VLGHSMGAFVIREAFDHADDGATTQTNWTANQLVLFAGDVDAASFSANDPCSIVTTGRPHIRLRKF
jgi:esterase/lipase superfamily enzyme